MSVRRALRAKALAMMSIMIVAMLARGRVPQHTLFACVVAAVTVTLTAYALVVGRSMQRNGASRKAVARTIVLGLVPFASHFVTYE